MPVRSWGSSLVAAASSGSLGALLLLLPPTVHAEDDAKGRLPAQGRSINQWLTSLHSKRLPERVEAVVALREAGPSARVAMPALIGLFREKEASLLQPLTAMALARIGSRAIPQLERALADPSPEVRAGTAVALGLMGRPARVALPALTRLLRDRHSLVHTTAAGALNAIQPRRWQEKLASLEPWEYENEGPPREPTAILYPLRSAEINELIDILLKLDRKLEMFDRIWPRIYWRALWKSIEESNQAGPKHPPNP
jgi:hypothetical protein